MKHYDYVEWVLYKKELLDDEIYNEMEEHLFLCDTCMEIFLSLIDEAEIEKVGDILPTDFTDKAMNNIKNIIPMKKRTKKKVSNDFFIYYAAVASVAIILTAGGFFEKMLDTVPYISANISSQENNIKRDTIYNFSEKITSKTSSFINDFGTIKNKED